MLVKGLRICKPCSTDDFRPPLARRDLAEQPHGDHMANHRLQRKVAVPRAADAVCLQQRLDRTEGKTLAVTPSPRVSEKWDPPGNAVCVRAIAEASRRNRNLPKIGTSIALNSKGWRSSLAAVCNFDTNSTRRRICDPNTIIRGLRVVSLPKNSQDAPSTAKSIGRRRWIKSPSLSPMRGWVRRSSWNKENEND